MKKTRMLLSFIGFIILSSGCSLNPNLTMLSYRYTRSSSDNIRIFNPGEAYPDYLKPIAKYKVRSPNSTTSFSYTEAENLARLATYNLHGDAFILDKIVKPKFGSRGYALDITILGIANNYLTIGDSLTFTKESLTDYFDKIGPTNDIQGIWCDTQNIYEVAIIRNSLKPDEYYSYIISSYNYTWIPGEIKFTLSPTSSKTAYIYKYLRGNKTTSKGVAVIHDNIIIEIDMALLRIPVVFIKRYPNIDSDKVVDPDKYFDYPQPQEASTI